MVGGFGEGFLGIVGYYEAPKGACESNVFGGPILLLQLGYILIVYVAGRPGHGEPIAVAGSAAQGGRGEAAKPDGWMRSLNWLGRHLDVLEVEEFALEGDGLSAEKPTNGFEGLICSPTALLQRHPQTFELFVVEADSDAELETPAGDHIDYSNVLSKAYWIVKRHQEHARRNANPFCSSGDRGSHRHNRRQIAVFDKVML